MSRSRLLRYVLAHLLLVAGLAFGGQALAQVVVVRNVQLVILKELRTRSELSEFQQLWSQRQATDRTSAQEHEWPYTIDILGLNRRVERWRYNPNGMAIPVNEGTQRVMKVKQPILFNTLIGAPKYL